MLMLAGEGVRAEEIESLGYTPGAAQDSGDLEAATKTITVTSKQGTPDYSTSLTVPAPSDSRITVLRLGLRLQVTIDSMASGQLNYSVEVNGVERLTGNWTGTGAKYAAVDLAGGEFNLGTANTITLFLWRSTANATISVAEIWLGIGTKDTGFWGSEVLEVVHSGLASSCSRITLVGTGTAQQMLLDGAFSQANVISMMTTDSILGYGPTSCLVKNGVRLHVKASVGTDLAYLYACTFVLRTLS